MSGVYVHIPFCRQACHYCDFHFSTSAQTKQAVLQCITRELELRREEATSPVETIYFGGGTPSLLHADELKQLLDSIFNNYPVLLGAEITLEANPDDLTAQKLKQLCSTPINRISVGVQSFHEADLMYLRRVHSAREAEYAVKGAQDAGVDNLTLDLIYGIPTLTERGWIENLEKAIFLQVPHLSAYALTVEEQTPLFHLIRRNKRKPPVDEQAARHFMILAEILPMAEFEQYEISNFAQPGFRSRHNSSYWKGAPYLGIGPSAHSFDGNATRRWNVASNMGYIKGITEALPWYEKETLTFENRVNEWIMIRLRTSEGIDLKETLSRFGNDVATHIKTILQNQPLRYIIQQDNKILLTNEGKLLADKIAAQCMI